MKPSPAELLGTEAAPHGAWHLTEHRPLDLYDRRRKLAFDDAPPEGGARRIAARLLQARHAHWALEEQLLAADAVLGEARGSWQRYLELPRESAVDKRVAEVYRLLRIVRIASAHAQGRAEWRDGLLHLACSFERCALALTITEVGLELLASFVAAHLEHLGSPYPPAWVERLLSQYFTDIVGEVRRFADEDRVLYQFQPRPFFNRHFRYDCENPRVRVDDTHVAFDYSAAHEPAALFPIDFFAFVDDRLHIVPAEALTARRLPLAELPRWQARCTDGRLPANLRGRFARERMVIGQPMT